MILRKKRGTLQPHHSSLVINIAPLLAARNITHGSSYLTKIGLSNVTVHKLLHGKAVQINLKQLTTLCLHLNCTPNDLFALRDMQLPPHHALQAIRPLGEAVPNITQWLAGKTVAEIKELMGGEGK